MALIKKNLLFSLTLTITISCATHKDPHDHYHNAWEALQDAKRAGADQYAPTEYRSAEDTFDKGNHFVLEKQNNEAIDTFVKATELAYLAKAAALYNKNLAANDENEENVELSALEEDSPIQETSPFAELEGSAEGINEDNTISEGDFVSFGDDSNGKFKLFTVYFEYDRYSLSEDTRNQLKENADWLVKNPNATLAIEGHCDERGSNEYNLALGQRRALSVKTYLSNSGVSDNRIKTLSYGEEKPVVWGHGESYWSQNRRATFNLSNNN